MRPTLAIGDFVLVNKFIWGIRLPVTNYKILTVDTPKRGDVMVFRYPGDPKMDYIKRVVGLPGDKIEYRDAVLYVNGEIYSQEFVGLHTWKDRKCRSYQSNKILEESNETSHFILRTPEEDSKMEVAIVVPPNSYWMLGDNRDGSKDSRWWGVVPEENIVGKAFFVWMNYNKPWGCHEFFDSSTIGGI